MKIYIIKENNKNYKIKINFKYKNQNKKIKQ